MKTLVLGCGLRKPPGSIGIDSNPHTVADILHDLNQTPYPLKSNQFDLIICHDILEHLDDMVSVMKEIHRLGKDGSYVEIKTPHFSSILSWDDPTHKHHFTSRSFDYFTNVPERWRTHFYTEEKFECLSKDISFTRAPSSLIGKSIYQLSPRMYVHHFTWIFPAKGIFVKLRNIKKPPISDAHHP
jgi:SAM-dependent methyltransferase